MLATSFEILRSSSFTMLRFLAGETALYVSVALAAWGMTRKHSLLPGRRAIGYTLPIAITFAMTLAAGGAAVAIGLAFGTCIAVLALVTGFIAISAPLGHGPYRWRRLWPFMAVAAILAFLGGFSGFLNWRTGVVLLIEGLVVLSLWLDQPASGNFVIAEEDAHSPAPAARQTASTAKTRSAFRKMIRWGPLAPLAVLAAIVLAVIGAHWALAAATRLEQQRHAPLEATASTLISMALVLPMVNWGRRMAIRKQSWSPLTAHAGVVMLNLCLLLPALALWPYFRSLLSKAIRMMHMPVKSMSSGITPSAFPLTVWRVDAVILMLLAFLQVGLATGKWTLGRAGGLILILGYCAFVMLLMAPGR